MNRRILICIAFFAAALSQILIRQSHASSTNARNRLVGAWQLVSTEERLSDGSKRPYRDLGPHGKGYLMYSADGHMCAALMNPDRPIWKDEDAPTPGEKASALDGFVAYCGRFEVDEAQRIVYHYPDVAWMPNYLGTKQLRPYVFDGDLLTFSDKVTGQPGVTGYSISWKKMK